MTSGWRSEVEMSSCTTVNVQVGDRTPEVVRIKADGVCTEGEDFRIVSGYGEFIVLKDEPLWWSLYSNSYGDHYGHSPYS